ncbi:MAG: TetR/AcrR family transcriptional regulator [Myxococcota bacterium]
MAGRPRATADYVEQRRFEIVRAASKVFAEKGYAAAQIADIAAELGIGHGTVYRYFKDKRHLLDAVIDFAILRVAGALANDQPSADSLEEYRAQVQRIGQNLFELVLEEPDLARLLFKEAYGADQELAAKMQSAMSAFASLTEGYLVNGKKKGFFRKDFNTTIAANAINAMVFEGARQVMLASDPRAAKREWMREIPELYLSGIRR